MCFQKLQGSSQLQGSGNYVCDPQTEVFLLCFSIAVPYMNLNDPLSTLPEHTHNAICFSCVLVAALTKYGNRVL